MLWDGGDRCSSFVLQDIYGLSPQLFSVMFGINALGLMLAGQVNGRLVGRVEPIRLLAAGLIACATGGAMLFLVVAFSHIGLPGILPSLFLVVSGLGFVMPNAVTLALSGKPSTAGSASALVGVLQFTCGAAAAPLVGAFGTATALPMAVVIAALDIAALLVFVILARGSRTLPQTLT
jgi:DHA1 family bicyclomycin/chloramphenicol resistance-like MFS transporter